MIGHIVLFSPKASLSGDQRRSFAQSVLSVSAAVPSIKRASIGRRVHVDPGYARSFGDTTYEFAAVFEFESRSGLVAYLTDPRHHELGRLFWEFCEKAIVSEVEFVDRESGGAVEQLAL